MLKKTCEVLLGILVMGTVLAIGCTGWGGPAQVKDGDTVKLHYSGTLANGEVFDTTEGREPAEFTLGQSMLIPGFEEAVKGMKVGESKTVTIPAEKAYGPHRDDQVVVVGRDQLPKGMDPKVGQPIRVQKSDGSGILVVVIDTSETTITIDANHPLTGKDLTFEIKILEIK